MLAHCYTPHCTPGPSPYAYKRKVQGSRTRGLAARENGPTHNALALALSHANACNSLLQAHPSALGAGQQEGRGFRLLFSPLCVPSRADPSGLGHAATIYSSVQGPPGVETPTSALLGTGALFTGRPSRRAACWMTLTPPASRWDRAH
jgi:hypothetical protein